jgi:hypothetical protein
MANMRLSEREFERAVRSTEPLRRQLLSWAWWAAASNDRDSYGELFELLQQLDALSSTVSKFVGRTRGRAEGF